MTPYPDLQVNKIKNSTTEGTIKSYQGSDPSATISFGFSSPHSSATDLSTGKIQQLRTGSRNRGLLFYP